MSRKNAKRLLTGLLCLLLIFEDAMSIGIKAFAAETEINQETVRENIEEANDGNNAGDVENGEIANENDVEKEKPQEGGLTEEESQENDNNADAAEADSQENGEEKQETDDSVNENVDGEDGSVEEEIKDSETETTVGIETGYEENSETEAESVTEDIIDSSTVSVTASNSFGKLLTGAMEEEILELGQTPENNISGITIGGKQAIVEFGCAKDAILIVAIYDESGTKMLASGKTEVTVQQIRAIVNIDVGNMPDYFIARGYLVDKDTLNPLSSVYETSMYTKEMQELLSKTVDDFDKDKVINFDDNKNNNFAVADENTKIISNVEGENIISEFNSDTQVCVIKNANEDITSLKVGDIFVYEYEKDEILIVKIAGIIVDDEYDGTKTATIYGQETTLDEVFAYLKIDTESELNEAQIDTSEMVDGIEYEGLYNNNAGRALMDEEDSLSWSIKFKFLDDESESKDDKLTGDVSFGIDFKVKIYMSLSYSYIEIKFDYKVELEFTVSSKSEYYKKELLPVPIGISPVAGVYIEFMPAIVIEASAKITLKGIIKGTFGYALSNDEGLKNISSGPSVEIEAEGEVELFVGISFEPQIKILSEKIAKASMDATAGGVISAKTDPYEDEGSITHECRFCLDGDISARYSIKVEAQLNIIKKITVTPLKYEMTYKILDFYYSHDFDEFAFTICPHHKYLVNVTVLDKNLKPVLNSYVEDGINPECYIVDDSGKASFYLPAGKHTVTAYLVDDKSITAKKDITIVDKAKEIKIVLSGYEVPNAAGVKDVEINYYTSSAVMGDGRLYTWGNGWRGRLGNGDTKHINMPVKILDNIDNYEILTNIDTSVALTKDGKLYIWGYKGNGDANSDESYYFSPVQLANNIKSVSKSFSYYPMAITYNKELYTWYQDNKVNYDKSPIKLLQNVKSCSSGNGNSAITNNNELYLWGLWESERFFDDLVGDVREHQPVKVMDNVADFKNPGLIHLDSTFAMVYGILSTDGSLYMFGNNEYGQLGNGEISAGSVNPIKILDNIVDFGMDGLHSWAIDTDRNLYMWGDNTEGQLGTGDNNSRITPTKILENVKNVYYNQGYTMAAVTQNGDLYMWGNNYGGTLGIGNNDEYCSIPTKILQNVKTVVLEYKNSAAITNDGKLYVWGDNETGQIGDGTKVSRYSPVKIMDNVRSVYIDSFATTAAVTNDDELYMWGDNTYGQLGNGTNVSSNIPVKVTFPQASSGAWSLNELQDSQYNVRSSDDGETSVDSGDIDTNPLCYAIYGSRINGNAVFEGLDAGEKYNIYEIKSREAEDILYSENLLYIGQTMADDNGKISYICEPREEYADAILFVVGENDKVGDDKGDDATKKCQVTFDSQGGEEIDPITEITPGSIINLPTNVKRSGYVFTGWYTDPVNGEKIDSTTLLVEHSITLYAYWIKAQSEAGLWVEDIADQIYTGKAIKPQVKVYDGTTLLKEKTDYTISYKNNTKANDASNTKSAPTVVVKGKGNYSGTETVTFKILPIDLSDTCVITEDITLAYNEKVQKKVPTVTYNGKKLANNKDFTVSYPALTQGVSDAFKAVGIYDIVLTAKEGGSFTGERTVKLTITNATLISKVTVKKIPNQTYTGNAIEPELTVAIKNVTLEKEVDYTVAYMDNTEVGTATAILTGIGDYAGVKKVTFKITGISVKNAELNAFQDKLTYNGSEQMQSVLVVVNNTILEEGTDYDVSYANNINAGNASIIIKGKGAYTGMKKQTFKILPCGVSASTDLSGDITVKYVKGGSKPELELTYAGKKLTKGKDYTVSYKNNNAITTAETRKYPEIIVKGKGNFTGTLVKYFTVTSKALNDTDSPVALSVADKGFIDKAGKYISNPVLTDVDGKKLVAGKDYEKAVVYILEDGTVLSEESIVYAGTNVKVKVTGKDAYTGELEGIYRITGNDFSKAKISINPQIYTGKAITLEKDDITVKIGNDILIYGTDYEIVEDSYINNVKKGTANVTIVGKGNYGGTKIAKYKITAQKFAWFWRIFG